MKAILFFILLTISYSGFSQKNNRTIDKKSNKEILIGLCDKEGMLEKPFCSWFKKGYRRYHPKKKIIKQLQESNIYKVDIVLVMATWCGDSRTEVPNFYKILNEINFDENKMIVMCVDRNKEALKSIISKLNIKKVPTFIFYIDGKEIGRIIETPENRLEKDLLKIIINNS